jgi:hypothetical protein
VVVVVVVVVVGGGKNQPVHMADSFATISELIV